MIVCEDCDMPASECECEPEPFEPDWDSMADERKERLALELEWGGVDYP